MDLVDLGRGDQRWEQALPVLQELRPDLTTALLDQVLVEGAPQGLRFLAAFDGARCLGVAGWRVMATTHSLRKPHVDDLVTASASRSAGVGAALLRELEQRARTAGCAVLDLDSGVQRHGAHRFYLRERMDITSHHFGKRI